jgi:hypothetical protein
MKLIASLLTLVLGSAMLYAQEKSQGVEMTGTICDSKRGSVHFVASVCCHCSRSDLVSL